MHLPAFQTLAKQGQAEFCAVCDLRPEMAQTYARDLGATAVHTDLERMLDECNPAGVAVLVQPEASAHVLARLAARRVPFIVEKPPAPDARTHRRLAEAAAGLPHVVAYNRRHCPYVMQAKEWLAGSPLQCVPAHFSRHRRREDNFSTTAVHAIDTARHLAGADLAVLRVEIRPAVSSPIRNFFLNGWTAAGTRVDILITPDTASAVEHYTLRATDRTVVVSFPQNHMLDLPGFVELQEENKVVRRMGPGDFGIAPHDQPALGGMLAEHTHFAQILRGQATPFSTLQTTLQTQEIRDELERLLAAGGRQESELRFTA